MKSMEFSEGHVLRNLTLLALGALTVMVAQEIDWQSVGDAVTSDPGVY